MYKQEKIKQTFDHARFIASTYSRDRNTKIGALILGPDGEPLSWGYNGFPRGVNDGVEERYERPTKYLWTEHAERNAIFNAARSGHKLLGSSIFVTTLCPCTDCSRAIIQSGIRTVYLEKAALDVSEDVAAGAKAWMKDWPLNRQMLVEAGVRIVVVNDKAEINEKLSNLV